MGALVGRLPVVPRRFFEALHGEHRVRYAERLRVSGSGFQPEARAPRAVEVYLQRAGGLRGFAVTGVQRCAVPIYRGIAGERAGYRHVSLAIAVEIPDRK